MASSVGDDCGNGAPPTDRSGFRFLDLPGEIRNAIYRVVLTHQGLLEPYRLLRKAERRSKKLIDLPILRVCRQIEHEATPLLFSDNTFSTRITLKVQPFPGMQYVFVDEWFLNTKHTFRVKHIVAKAYSTIDVGFWDVGSAVRVLHAAQCKGLKVTVQGYYIMQPRSIDVLAFLSTLMDNYWRFSTYGRSFKTVKLNNYSRPWGLILFDKPVEDLPQTQGGNSFAKFEIQNNSGKELTFTTPSPSRLIYELPVSVQLKIADYATDSEAPIEITLDRNDWSGPWREPRRDGPLMMNRSLREGSSPYYFKNTRFRVHVEIEAYDPWHRQFSPVKNWVNTYLPGRRKGTPLAVRHVALILDFSRSEIRLENVRIQLIHFIRLLLHVNHDAVEIVVKTVHSSTSISLQALRHKALTALTKMFGLNYLNHGSVSWICPAVWIDGNGRIASTSLKPNHNFNVPEEKYYISDKQNELLGLYRGLARPDHNRKGGKYGQPKVPDGLSSVGSCMSYLRQVLEEPKRVKELTEIYEFSPFPSFYQVHEIDLHGEWIWR